MSLALKSAPLPYSSFRRAIENLCQHNVRVYSVLAGTLAELKGTLEMLLARLTEPRRPHSGHSACLCIHPIPWLLWSRGLGLAAQRLECIVSGMSPVSDTALFIVVNVISLDGCTPQLTPSPSDCLFPNCMPLLGPIRFATWSTWLWAVNLKWPSVSGEASPVVSYVLSTVCPGQWCFIQGLGPGLGYIPVTRFCMCKHWFYLWPESSCGNYKCHRVR